jgi:hypothetical protein
MKYRMRNNKGSGAVTAVIAAVAVIYVILPLCISIIQKAIIYHETARIKEVIELAVMSLVTCNDTLSFSQKDLIFDTNEYDLINIIYEQVSVQLKDIVELNKEDMQVVICSKGMSCICGYVSLHDLIYVDIDATLRFAGIYNNIHGFSIHSHIEIPVV